jgi:endoglucanase
VTHISSFPSPGTDAAAAASAAFSSCSNLYANRTFHGTYAGPATLQNHTYAQILQNHAEELYIFALNATGGQHTYQTCVPAVSQSYPSSGFGDDITIAALFLSVASNSSYLFNQAEQFYNQYKLAGQNGVFNWDSKTPGLAVLFAQITQGSYGFGGNMTAYQLEAERYFDQIVNHKGPAYMTNGQS